MKPELLRDWLALSLWEELGPKAQTRLRMSIPNPCRVLDDPGLLDVIFTGNSHPGPPPQHALRQKADQLIELSNQGKFQILSIQDPQYPHLLANIHTPPPILYYQGDVRLLTRPALAIVGTRKPSQYGHDVTTLFAGTLARHPFVIVSGLALGIDAIAHTAALDNDGTTVAVLGCGLDNPYPKSNKTIRKRIEESGCIVTEFPWGNRPNPAQFPRRNRIISGLSLGVLIVESTEKSGALITVKHAFDQNRDVFSIPGSIFSPGSKGPVRVLQNGGYPVLEPDDIFIHYANRETLPFSMPATDPEELDVDPNLRPIWDLLDATPVSVDDLIAALRWGAADIQTALLKMELLSLIKQLPGQRYVRADSRGLSQE